MLKYNSIFAHDNLAEVALFNEGATFNALDHFLIAFSVDLNKAEVKRLATRIPEAVIDQIRDSVNIADIVGQYVELKKSGKNLFGLCPFQEEKTPSFSVAEDKQIFNCFSCHRGGNVFRFIMEIEQIDFPAAVLKVAELGQVDIDLSSYQNSRPQSQVDPLKTELLKLYQSAATLFQHVLLNTAAGEAALAYAHQRQLDDDQLKTFQVGYAPDQDNLLLRFFQEKQVDFQLLRRSGLFTEREDGSLRDRFRDRLMFPIRDAKGQVIAFSGRLLHAVAQLPKYLNSPETPLFNKRDVLFNLDLARPEIRRHKQVVLFEGFMDVIAAYRAGIQYGVASMGTSLTNEQLHQLQRMTGHLIVCYDGDLPGLTATNRVITLLRQDQRFQLSVVLLPEQLDPDEYIKKYQSESFRKKIEESQLTATAFRLKYLRQGKKLDHEQDKITYTEAALQELLTVRSTIERDVYLHQLSQTLDLSYDVLVGQLQQLLANATRKREQTLQSQLTAVPAVQSTQVHLNRVERAERDLLHLFWYNRQVRDKLMQQSDFAMVHDPYQVLYTLSQTYFVTNETFNAAAFSDYAKSEDLQGLAAEIDQMPFDDSTGLAQLDDYLITIRRFKLETQLKQTQQQAHEATQIGDDSQALQLLQQLVGLKKQIEALSV